MSAISRGIQKKYFNSIGPQTTEIFVKEEKNCTIGIRQKMDFKKIYIFFPGEKMFFVGGILSCRMVQKLIQYDHKQRRYNQNSNKINMGFRQSDYTKIGPTRRIRRLFFRFEFNQNGMADSSSSLLREPTHAY